MVIAGSSHETAPSPAGACRTAFRELDDEFLQAQTKIWLGEMLHLRFHHHTSVPDLLADGELLFEVSWLIWRMLMIKHPMESKHSKVNVRRPVVHGRIGSRYLPYSNVDVFLKVCKFFGLTGVDICTPSDVVERRDIRRVCMCIRALSKKARARNLDVLDFDIVTNTLVMPSDMVGYIRRNLEKSRWVSIGYLPAPSSTRKYRKKWQEISYLSEQHSEGSNDAGDSLPDLDISCCSRGPSHETLKLQLGDNVELGVEVPSTPWCFPSSYESSESFDSNEVSDSSTSVSSRDCFPMTIMANCISPVSMLSLSSTLTSSDADSEARSNIRTMFTDRKHYAFSPDNDWLSDDDFCDANIPDEHSTTTYEPENWCKNIQPASDSESCCLVDDGRNFSESSILTPNSKSEVSSSWDSPMSCTTIEIPHMDLKTKETSCSPPFTVIKDCIPLQSPSSGEKMDFISNEIFEKMGTLEHLYFKEENSSLIDSNRKLCMNIFANGSSAVNMPLEDLCTKSSKDRLDFIDTMSSHVSDVLDESIQKITDVDDLVSTSEDMLIVKMDPSNGSLEGIGVSMQRICSASKCLNTIYVSVKDVEMGAESVVNFLEAKSKPSVIGIGIENVHSKSDDDDGTTYSSSNTLFCKQNREECIGNGDASFYGPLPSESENRSHCLLNALVGVPIGGSENVVQGGESPLNSCIAHTGSDFTGIVESGSLETEMTRTWSSDVESPNSPAECLLPTNEIESCFSAESSFTLLLQEANEKCNLKIAKVHADIPLEGQGTFGNTKQLQNCRNHFKGVKYVGLQSDIEVDDTVSRVPFYDSITSVNSSVVAIIEHEPPLLLKHFGAGLTQQSEIVFPLVDSAPCFDLEARVAKSQSSYLSPATLCNHDTHSCVEYPETFLDELEVHHAGGVDGYWRPDVASMGCKNRNELEYVGHELYLLTASDNLHFLPSVQSNACSKRVCVGSSFDINKTTEAHQLDSRLLLETGQSIEIETAGEGRSEGWSVNAAQELGEIQAFSSKTENIEVSDDERNEQSCKSKMRHNIIMAAGGVIAFIAFLFINRHGERQKINNGISNVHGGSRTIEQVYNKPREKGLSVQKDMYAGGKLI